MGGENTKTIKLNIFELGSSPRGRGKRFGCTSVAVGSGLIPAWAGKTGVASSVSAGLAAHPRVGGENHGNSVTRVRRPGSSPRGRGKPDQRLQDLDPRGLIPAWAGKTVSATLAIA